MIGRTGRLGATIVAGLAPFAVVTVVSPAVGNAAECGQGTVYDAGSNTCIVAQAALPLQAQPPPPGALPPPPPPA
jgi:hypothetical protein